MAVSITNEIECVYFDDVIDPNHTTPIRREVSMQLVAPQCHSWDKMCQQQGAAWVPAITVCRQHLWL